MVQDGYRKNLFAIVGAYAKATGLSLSTISRKFYGNQAFLGNFKRGDVSISLEKADQILTKFGESWPPGLDWPITQPIEMSRPPDRRKRRPGKIITKAVDSPPPG